MSVIAPPSATGPLPETSLEPPVRHLGKLWKRCVAYLVDLFIISIPAYLIALPFSEFLCRSGPWGRLIGFCIAFPYYTLFNSDIGGGRTPGKRLLFLQLVDGQGQTIPLSSSALRYTLLFAPFFLNGLALPISHTPATLILAIEETTLILGFGTLYLVLFNQHTHQGLHDLAAGTYVIDEGSVGPVTTRPIWKMHWVIGGILLANLCIGAVAFSGQLLGGPFPQLLRDVKAVEQIPGVQRASARSWITLSHREIKPDLIIQAFWTENSEDEDSVANQVAGSILESDPAAGQYGNIRIVITRGYDLGITHSWQSQTITQTPAAWRELLYGK